MRLVLVLGLGSIAVCAQTCAPLPMLPAGQTAGALSDSSCKLSDGTAYDSYRVVLPVRGQFQAHFDAAISNPAVILQDASGARLASVAAIQRHVEAGTYAVIVNGDPAAYSLQTSFTAEPSMWCSNFAALGWNQNVAGTVGASGCKLPDGTPYEAYSLSTFGGGMLTVSVSSDVFTPLLMVRSGDGTLLASDAASVQVAVTPFSSYQVVVSTGDNTGAYRISTNLQVDPSETCVAQKSLTDSAAHSGSITGDSCATVIDGGGDEAYFNYYNLIVPAPGLADIAVSSTDFAATVNLLDATGNVVASDAGAQAEIRFPVRAGSYVVQVFSNFPSGGDYKLNYTFTPGPPQPCLAKAYEVGAAQANSISPSSCRIAVGLGDLYTVTLPSAGTLTLDIAAAGFASVAAIRDTKDNLIAMNEDVQGIGVSHVAATLPAGTYTIVAAASSGGGFYQMTTRFDAATIAPCIDGQTLAINTGFVRALGIGSCTGANGKAVDLYRFTMASAGVIAAIMTSSQVDGFITLTDKDGNVVRTDESSYAPNDPLIVQYLAAGDYQLWARSAGAVSGGLYQMTLLGALGGRPAFCDPVEPLVLGGNASGALGIASCQYVDQSWADVYRVDLASDTIVDLRLDSGDFDAALVVLDAKGNVIAQDDDSGGGTNARVVQSLSAGTYFVVAKQFANYYPGGQYQVTLAPYQDQ